MRKEGEVAMTYLVEKKENTPQGWCILQTYAFQQLHWDVNPHSQTQSHKLKCHILEVGYKILFTVDNYLHERFKAVRLWRVGNSCRIHFIFHCSGCFEAAVSFSNATDWLTHLPHQSITTTYSSFTCITTVKTIWNTAMCALATTN